MISGIHDGIDPVASIPKIASEPRPCCQIRTTTPQAAATLRMLSTIAFSGSSSERNARASRMKVVIVISAIISGKLP